MGMGAEEGRGMLKLDASAVGTLVWLFIITHGSLVQALYKLVVRARTRTLVVLVALSTGLIATSKVLVLQLVQGLVQQTVQACTYYVP